MNDAPDTTLTLPDLPLDAAGRCGSCGSGLRLRLPVGSPDYLRRIAAAQLAGLTPIECEPCTERREREEAEREAREHTQRVRARRLLSSGIPAKWQGATFDALERDATRLDAIREAEKWGHGMRRGLLLEGPVGRGKTQIAAAAAMRRIARGPVRWLSVADLLLKLRMPFSSPEYAKALRTLDAITTRGAALVLDDLNKITPNDHAVQPLYVAVNGWVEAQLPLLVTMNGTLDELEKDFGQRFGEPIASRLAEHCKVVHVGGRDRRVDP
jgi:DNA replication protein DnaC